MAPVLARLLVASFAVGPIVGCAARDAEPSSPATSPTADLTAVAPRSGSVVITGRILTMSEPPVAEALLIEDGMVSAVGTRDEVLAQADDQVPVVDLGQNVAYPGFIDAHAHWIGDRAMYGISTPAEAMDAALRRGWTSISEQWVNPERLADRNRAYPGSPDWMQDQLLTAEQGLRAITVDAAYALGDETRRGHLAPGTLGDLTILSGDVTDATPDEIRAMTVVATIVDGIPGHCADATICSVLPDGGDR